MINIIDDMALALGVSRWFVLAFSVVISIAVANIIATVRLINKIEAAALVSQ